MTLPRQYPRPGSNAERILDHIQENDGVTTNAIIRTLAMNPSVVRKCLASLIDRGFIVDKPDEAKNHHYSAKVPVV